jgi:serine/threonine-protein kinase
VILGAERAGPEQRARLRREAEAVARLQHPHIVQFYEFGEHAGKPYFALEYADGGSLAGWLGGAPVAPRLAAALVRTLAVAMHFAHEHGVVHGGLEPANVLLASNGLLKITDFGLARRTDQETSPIADIRALGAILYEMLTGKQPGEEPVPPSRLQAKVPHDLETICLKCLEKEPGRRYASAGALVEDLQRHLGGEPIRARPASVRERLVQWARRRPTSAALVLLLALTGLALVVALWFAW